MSVITFYTPLALGAIDQAQKTGSKRDAAVRVGSDRMVVMLLTSSARVPAVKPQMQGGVKQHG